MKKMKRIMCLLLAMVLVLGMSMTVLASAPGAVQDPGEETTEGQQKQITAGETAGEPGKYTIKAPVNENHVYEVYQIFIGDVALDENGNKILSNIKWGKNGTGTKDSPVEDGVLEILQGLLTASGTDKDKNAVIEGYVNFSEAFATLASGASESVPAGYYLIKDIINDGAEDQAYTLNIVQIIGDVNITLKSDMPEVHKEVQENSDGSWGNHADYNIDDQVEFRLIGTLPDNYDMYNKYTYIFHDTLSGGLTFDVDSKNINASVTVYKAAVSDGSVTKIGDQITSGYSVVLKPDGDEAEEWDGCSFHIIFTDLKTAVTDWGEYNGILVEYTATLNENATTGKDVNNNKVKLEFSNNPNSDGKGDTDTTGTTPEDEVVVLTFSVEVDKVDETDNALAGAGFTLWKWIVTDENPEGTWVEVETIAAGDTTEFVFKGIDAGKYKLEESTVPSGYNKADDIEFVVEAVYDETQDPAVLDSLVVKDSEGNVLISRPAGVDGDSIFTVTLATGELITKVVNKSGINLPETGGIGTTIFYVLGGILVVGCGVILVTRKRVGSKAN